MEITGAKLAFALITALRHFGVLILSPCGHLLIVLPQEAMFWIFWFGTIRSEEA